MSTPEVFSSCATWAQRALPVCPKWGQLPIPQKLLAAGIRDMVRISDARMSGTNYGACVLHAAPESFVGGPLALLKEGDVVQLDVPARQLNMRISDEELSRRRTAWRPKEGIYPRGYGRLFMQYIKQADEGCDFDFLEGTAPIPEPDNPLKFPERIAAPWRVHGVR